MAANHINTFLEPRPTNAKASISSRSSHIVTRRLNSLAHNNGQQLPPVVAPLPPSSGGLTPKSLQMHQRFLAHPLQPLHMRNSSTSSTTTCFEAKLTILEPELNDQRDYTLSVSNKVTTRSGIVRVRVSSPLSPMIMISSAFVTICGLFLFSLLVIFLLKRRHESTATTLHTNANGHSPSSGEKKGTGSVEHLVNGTSKTTNNATIRSNGSSAGNANVGLLQHAGQTRGIVNGSGNGLANGAANPVSQGMLAEEAAAKLHHNLMSMASSDTSGDQKQLLTHTSSSSERNSPMSGGSTNNTNTCAEFHVNSSSSAGHSASSTHSSPSPLNHISVEHDFHHEDHKGSTYQPAESVTNDAELSPHGLLGHRNSSALIYANLEYSEQHSPMAAASADGTQQQQQQHSPSSYRAGPAAQQARIRQQVPPADLSISHSPTGSVSTNDSRLHYSSSIRRSANNRDSFGAQTTATDNTTHSNPHQSPQVHRSSVGATIAMMNSLAAAAAAASSNATPSVNSPSTGVLNGAIQQQLASSKQLRKPGPPKPPKPSIQQRSRFYQQQQQQQRLASDGSSNASGDLSNNGLVMIGSQNPRSENESRPTSDQLAAEYSRIAFPARAEL